MCSMDALSPGAGQPATVARRDPLRRFGAWYRRHVWPATALLIVIVAAAGFAVLQAVSWNQAGDGVSVAGVPVGGLDEAAVAAAVEDQVAPRIAGVRLETGGEAPIDLTLDQLGITLDAPATARRALASGRRDLPLGLSVWLPGGDSGRRARRARRRHRLQEGPGGGPRRGRRTGQGRAPQAQRRGARRRARRAGARSRRRGARARHPRRRGRRAQLRRPGPDPRGPA